MTTHSSATTREQEPHELNSTTQPTGDALRRRAQYVINNKAINPQSRAIVRYGLETNDPWLRELVRRALAGETFEDMGPESTSQTDDDDRRDDSVESLAEIICRANAESAVSLLVLMSVIENAAHPKALANQAKHLAFTRCGELNLYGIVDTQIAMLERELLTCNVSVA